MKRAARQQMRAKLRQLGPDARRLASEAIVERLLPRIVEVPVHEKILVYAALSSEPDVSGLMKKRPDLKFVYPRVVTGDRPVLELYAVSDLARDAEQGAFGVLEPVPERCQRVDPQELACVLVPGMAFSPRGARLGKGGGYYDALLGHLGRPAMTIGVCFDFQMLQEIPLEPHDQLVDGVVTEARSFPEALGELPAPTPGPQS